MMRISRLFNMGDVAQVLYTVMPLSWMFALTRLQGRIGYLRNAKLREAVQANIAACFGDTHSAAQIARLTREWFEAKQQRDCLAIVMSRVGPKRLEALMPIEGLEHLDRALEAGKGAVLVGSHLNSKSNFPGIYRLRHMGYDVHVVMPTEEDPFAPTLVGRVINRLFKVPPMLEQIGAFYAQFNIRPIVRCLSGNGVPLLLGDGFHSTGFVPAQFMGRKVYFTSGPMSVARIAGAALLPVFVTGTAPDRLRLVIEAPIPVEKTANSAQDLEAMAGEFARRLEKHVRENISSWQHWEFPDVVGSMERVLDKSVEERLHV